MDAGKKYKHAKFTCPKFQDELPQPQFAKVHLHPFPHASVDPQKPVAIMHPVLWFRAMVLSQVFKKTGRKAYRLQSAWIQRNPRREKHGKTAQFGNVDPIRPNWPWADKTCILLPRFSAQILLISMHLGKALLLWNPCSIFSYDLTFSGMFPRIPVG